MDDLLPDFLVMNVRNATLNDSTLPNEVHSSRNGDVESVVCVTSLTSSTVPHVKTRL
jgi:hypothetical protein